MLNVYTIPLYLFIITNYKNTKILFTKKNKLNHFFFLNTNNKTMFFFKLLKHSLLTTNTFVVDISCFDNSQIKLFKTKFNLLYFISYYNNDTLTRVTHVLPIKNKKTSSLSHTYLNTSWLEREVCEMFGIFCDFQTDTRKLLLEYSQKNHPLLKTFFTSGYKETYYDILEEQILCTNAGIVEL